MNLDLLILRSDEGTPTGRVQNICTGCSPSYRLFGGCDTMDMGFVAEFDAPPIATKGDMVQVLRNGIPLFSGRVLTCEPQFGKAEQQLKIEGWWKRLKEREAVTPPLLDHITFGQLLGSDHPEITTAYGVVQWILNNRILNDPDAMITQGAVYPPAVPCKLSGPFMLYAKDDLGKVLETLATMEDCVTGIDSAGRFYYIPRQDVESGIVQTVYIRKDIPPDWRDRGIGIPDGGGKFVYDRRGPNAVAVYSRDSFDVPSIRSYNLVGVLPPSTKRTAGVRAANIHTGVQARRYARGLFRRFCDYSMKVEELSFRTATKQIEPHLGKVRIEGPEGTVYAEKIAGQVNITIHRSTITCSVTLGENAADPGSENPLNDPFADSPGWDDDSQVDTGLGTDIYPLPSGDIDFDDGFDGDGDDLHLNPDREFPLDPPGAGVEGVDYGQDTKNPDNGPGGGGDAYGATLLGIITQNAAHPKYSVRIVNPDGSEPEPPPPPEEGEEPEPDPNQLNEIDSWPVPVPRLQIGQRVLVNRTGQNSYFVDGAIGGRKVKLNVKSVLPANKYEIELLDPLDGITVIGTFTNVDPWPLGSVFGVGQKVPGYWFNGATVPTPLGSGGCCGGYFQGHDDLGFAGQVITD